ncbi:hypothetical protein F0562_010187 [Nyssa sinensis]|uniref:Uncharacterized protein n=1 Tax=Nyssa sinensis TaxID=561372 RepID=A0A5J5A0T9_9ASTE|nr:hypothetical protein F0562_010187 [Nyssa sinensis]
MGQLHSELEASEQVISGLKEKAAEVVNGEALVMDRVNSEDGEKGLMGLKLQWPVVATSAGTIAAVAVVGYFRYGSRSFDGKTKGTTVPQWPCSNQNDIYD